MQLLTSRFWTYLLPFSRY